jgi:hypothetical protein
MTTQQPQPSDPARAVETEANQLGVTRPAQSLSEQIENANEAVTVASQLAQQAMQTADTEMNNLFKKIATQVDAAMEVAQQQVQAAMKATSQSSKAG